MSQDPARVKQIQFHYLLKMDDEVHLRLLAVSMAQFMAIARFDDIKKWCLKNLHVFTYSTLLSSVGCMDIPVLLITQYTSKGKRVRYGFLTLCHHYATQDGSLPNERVLVRHKRWDACPIFALALYFYHRFVLWNETPINLLSDAAEW